MFTLARLLTLVSVTCWTPSIFTAASVIDPSNSRSMIYTKYTMAHSLGGDYLFDARDGWQTINVTDLQYKYSGRTIDDYAHEDANHQETSAHTRRSSKKKSAAKSTKTSSSKVKSLSASTRTSSKAAILGGSVTHALDSVWNSLKGIGKPEDVTITWYTGHDLLNPSCWSNSGWAPTDASFACALTLDGWTTRPKCFKFLELCTTPKTCVFVRVVDTCAGCAAGSKHVDLTKSAFGQLASVDEGILSVQMRLATEPSEWFEDLWGPRN